MKILVVGAGIAGLAAARAIGLAGFECDVVERAQDAPIDGGAIFLLGNATRALDHLGVLERVRDNSHPIASQKILTRAGRKLNETRTADVWGGCGPCLALRRKDLLIALAGALPSTMVQYGTTVTRIYREDRTTNVTFSDGVSKDYDLVIGADGIRSTVRYLVFGSAPPRKLGFHCWRLVTDNLNGIDGWTVMLSKGRTLLGIPLPDDKLYIYADCTQAAFGDGSIQTLKSLFSDFAMPLGGILNSVDPTISIHRAELEEVPISRWSSNGIVLIGDAAHASSPSMAQGAGMALEDAIVLERVLTRYDIPLQTRLDRFHHLRKERVSRVQQQSRARDKLRTKPDFLRNTIIWTIGSALYRRSYEPLLASP